MIAVIIITKYIIKQTVGGGGGWGHSSRAERGGYPPTRRKPLKDTRKGLKTVPFQCQGRWGGVNERLGEGAGG